MVRAVMQEGSSQESSTHLVGEAKREVGRVAWGVQQQRLLRPRRAHPVGAGATGHLGIEATHPLAMKAPP